MPACNNSIIAAKGNTKDRRDFHFLSEYKIVSARNPRQFEWLEKVKVLKYELSLLVWHTILYVVYIHFSQVRVYDSKLNSRKSCNNIIAANKLTTLGIYWIKPAFNKLFHTVTWFLTIITRVLHAFNHFIFSILL